jgi:hypothetical protein
MNGAAPPRAKKSPRRTKGEGQLGRAVNAVGVATSAILMLLAVLRAPADGTDPATRVAFPSLFEQIGSGSPAALATAACGILVITPVLRIVIVAGSLALQKRWGFAAAAVALVGILGFAFASA